VEENFKNRLILGLGILNLIFILFWISSCNNEHKFKAARDKEMNSRLESEQKLSEFDKIKTGLDEKFNKVQQELTQEKAALESTKKSLVQEQLVSNSLKAELEKISKLKEALEEDLKEALVKGKSSSAEKTRK
jgi:septal ring factor EnvC (AmiA/AmiB activator)